MGKSGYDVGSLRSLSEWVGKSRGFTLAQGSEDSTYYNFYKGRSGQLNVSG